MCLYLVVDALIKHLLCCDNQSELNLCYNQMMNSNLKQVHVKYPVIKDSFFEKLLN